MRLPWGTIRRAAIAVRPACVIDIKGSARLCSRWQARKADENRNQSQYEVNAPYQFLTSAALPSHLHYLRVAR